MTVSVAMATFDGAEFLESQLQSIADQTLLPDELVVSDDCSSDDTCTIVKNFARAAPFPVKLIENPKHLGLCRNFSAAITACQGEMIALADQDDVWLDHKLARAVAILEARPNIGLVCSDALYVDRLLQSLGITESEYRGLDRRVKTRLTNGDAFGLLLYRNFALGTTVTFRADLREACLPIPPADSLCVHDGWIALVAAATSAIAYIPEPLVLYRQHEAQTIGTGTFRTSGTSWVARTQPRFSAYGFVPPTSNVLRLRDVLRVQAERNGRARECLVALESRIDHVRGRERLAFTLMARIPWVIREFATMRYHRFSAGTRSAVRDLVLGRRKFGRCPPNS